MLAMVRAGSGLSAAAMVAISAPTSAKITVTTPLSTAVIPKGAKPRSATRFCAWPTGSCPNRKIAPNRMKAMMAATLIEANQNSNSPKEPVERRFTPVISARRPQPIAQTGMSGTHSWMILAPAMASTAATITQKYQ